MSQCPAPPSRCESFASLGDTQNFINGQLTETETSKYSVRCDGEGKNKVCHNITAFDSTWAYVMSPSETVTKMVEDQLYSKGIVDHVKHYPYPGDMLKLAGDSWDNNADMLALLFRLAYPTRPEEMKTYVANAKENNKIFRVTVPSDQIDDFKLYSNPTLIERKMNRMESVVDENAQEIVSNQQLKDGLEQLIQNIKDTDGKLGWKAKEYTFDSGLPDNGFVCLDTQVKCEGDNRDTYYPMNVDLLKSSMICETIPILCNKEASTSVLSNAYDDFMIIAGVDHKTVGRVEYASLSILGEQHLNSVGARSDPEMAGSAEVYLDDPVAKYLYALIFARDCTGRGKFCFVVEQTGDVSIPIKDQLIYVERGYINPVTHIGNDRSEIIPPKVIHYAPVNEKVLAE